MKNNKIYFLLLAILMMNLHACWQRKTSSKAKIIGKIINPKKTEIVISKDPFNIQSDTLYIQSGNKFSGEIKVENEGLNYIFIFPEFQMIYLKPGDSLAFVLNTTEFDESLSFSGTSGFENNLLLELFLANEKENIEISRLFKDITPIELNRKLDSFYKIKKQMLQTYNKQYKNTSAHFKKIVESYNKVAQYRIKENYLMRRQGEIPPDFTKYRKFLHNKMADPNLPDLLYFSKTFVENRLREEQTPTQKKPKKAIDIIVNEMGDPILRDNILMIYCKNYIIEESIKNENDSIYMNYMNLIQSPDYKAHCAYFIEKNKCLSQGQNFPDIKVRDASKKIYSLHDILKNHKNLIAYWDLFYRTNFKSNMKKLQKIKEEYPELQIIILNDNPDDFDEWKLQIPQNNDFKFYQFPQISEEMDKLLPYGLNQVFLLDSTYINHSLINLYDISFQRRIKDFMKPE
jgi:hypothetical protein